MKLEAIIDYGGAALASWLAWGLVSRFSPVAGVFAAILGFGAGLYLARSWRLENL